MDRDTAITIVKRRLGQRSDNLDTQIIDEMDNVQLELEMNPVLPWFLLSEDQSASTVVDEDRVRVPTGFLREYEDGALWVYDSDADVPWALLVKKPEDMLRKSLGDTLDATGQPLYYALSGPYFRLAPVPDAVYTLKIKCYEADTLPNDFANGADTNGWLTNASQLIIAETVLTMAQHLQYERGLLQTYERRATRMRDRFWRDQEARRHANVYYQFGD